MSIPGHLLQPNDDFVCPTNIINNMWRIIGQETPITANQHRDLQNLMALLRQQGDYAR